MERRKFSGEVREWLGFWSPNAYMITQRSKRMTDSNIWYKQWQKEAGLVMSSAAYHPPPRTATWLWRLVHQIWKVRITGWIPHPWTFVSHGPKCVQGQGHAVTVVQLTGATPIVPWVPGDIRWQICSIPVPSCWTSLRRYDQNVVENHCESGWCWHV